MNAPHTEVVADAKELAAKRKGDPKKIPGFKKGRGTLVQEDMVINILEPTNKKKEGTGAYRQYQVLLEHDGKTVAECQKAWPDDAKASLKDELRHCIGKGWVELKPAA